MTIAEALRSPERAEVVIRIVEADDDVQARRPSTKKDCGPLLDRVEQVLDAPFDRAAYLQALEICDARRLSAHVWNRLLYMREIVLEREKRRHGPAVEAHRAEWLGTKKNNF